VFINGGKKNVRQDDEGKTCFFQQHYHRRGNGGKDKPNLVALPSEAFKFKAEHGKFGDHQPAQYRYGQV